MALGTGSRQRLPPEIFAYLGVIRGANDFTADVVLTDGRESAKVGRRFRPNERLELVT